MKTDMSRVSSELAQHLLTLRQALDPVDGSDVDTALCAVETYCAVAMIVMKQSNPSKVRGAAMTVEIKARMDGIPVIREAA